MANGWHRKNANSPAAQARRREYNSREYRHAKQAGQRDVDAGRAHCWRCGQHIPPRTPWHLGHDDHDRRITRGTECVPCNLQAAARKGAATVNRRPTTPAPWHSRRW